MNTQLKSRIAFVGLAVTAFCVAVGVLVVGLADPVEALKPPWSPLATPISLPVAPGPEEPPVGALSSEPTPLPYGPKGIGGQDTWGILDYDVWYLWGVSQDVTDPRFARMVWCPTDYHLYALGVYTQTVQTAQNDYADQIQGRVWLIFNEPDHPGAQCGMYRFSNESLYPVYRDPVEAAVRYAFVYDTIKQYDPHARVFAGGLLYLNSVEPVDNNTRWWWSEFLDTLEANGDLDKLEGVHVHAYSNLTTSSVRVDWPELLWCPHENCQPELAKALNDWYTDVHQADLRTRDLPIWITETGWLHCTGEEGDPAVYLWVRDECMAPMAEWFYGHPGWSVSYPGVPSNPGYDSIIWYHSRTTAGFWCTWLVDEDDALTPGGEYWNALPLPVFDVRLPLAMRHYSP